MLSHCRRCAVKWARLWAYVVAQDKFISVCGGHRFRGTLGKRKDATGLFSAVDVWLQGYNRAAVSKLSIFPCVVLMIVEKYGWTSWQRLRKWRRESVLRFLGLVLYFLCTKCWPRVWYHVDLDFFDDNYRMLDTRWSSNVSSNGVAQVYNVCTNLLIISYM